LEAKDTASALISQIPKPCETPPICGIHGLMPRLAFSLSLIATALLIAADKKPSDLTLRDLSGKKVQLRDHRGKVVVLNFWATWCVPCREEMPMLVDAQKTWATKGVTFIAVSLDEPKTRPNIATFIEQHHVEFPVWTGASTDELDKLRMGNGVPDTAFLDENGIVIARVLGEIRRSELDERLAWLTGDRRSVPPAALVNHMGAQ
jgi:thiol-disulfide isomerase/thioredoxin